MVCVFACVSPVYMSEHSVPSVLQDVNVYVWLNLCCCWQNVNGEPLTPAILHCQTSPVGARTTGSSLTASSDHQAHSVRGHVPLQARVSALAA